MCSAQSKPPIASVLGFGANNYIGRPLAQWITDKDPGVRLRLAIRNESHRAELAQVFPEVEIVRAGYHDLLSPQQALDLTGRPASSLREWLAENKHAALG